MRVRSPLTWLAALGGVVWLAALAAICLTPSYGGSPDGFWGEWIPEYQGFSGFLLNIILFLPGGAALGVLTRRIWPGLLLSLLLSIGIETLQIWIPGRHTSGGDLLANALGGWIGAALLVRREILLFPSPATSRRLAFVWLGVTAISLASFGPLTIPVAPEVTLYSGWTPELRALEHYDGRVLFARIGDLFLPEGGPIPEEEQLRLQSLVREGARVEVTFLAGSRPSSLAPIVRVAGSDGNETLLVGADRDDLVVRRRLLADHLRLARPDLRVRGAHRELAPGDTVRIVAERGSSGQESVTVNGEPHTFEFSPARGWSFLRYPSSRSEGVLEALDLTYLSALALPLGWWAPSLTFLGAGVGGILTLFLVLLPLGGVVGGSALQGLGFALGALAAWLVRNLLTGIFRQRPGAALP